MDEPPRTLFSLRLPCDTAAPGRVREELARLEWVGWVLGDVMLVADELVTNAVLHSGCPVGDPLQVSAHLALGHLRISVLDPGLSATDAAVRPTASEDGGWGLMIVEQLSARWGAERDRGYNVWAEVEIPQAPPGAAAGDGNAAGLMARRPL